MARRAMGACAMAMGAMAKRAMGGRAMAMGAMAIGARGGLLQQQPLSRGGDQCRDVRGPALKLGRGEPASRGAEPIQLGRARRTAEQAAIAARAGNPINPVVAGTGGGALQCWRVEADTCRGGFALAHVLQRSKQGGYCNAYWSRSRHAPRSTGQLYASVPLRRWSLRLPDISPALIEGGFNPRPQASEIQSTVLGARGQEAESDERDRHGSIFGRIPVSVSTVARRANA